MGATMGQHKVHTTERLKYLRDLMRKEDVNVQAFVVPSEDQRTCTPHFLVVIKNFFSFLALLDSSEYLASCDQRRAFISGFNGSAGTCNSGCHSLALCSVDCSRKRDRYTG